MSDTLRPEAVREHLHTKWLGQELYYEETLDSTNTRAKALARQGAAHGTVVLTEEQTGGRGRMGRGWVTPKGSSVAMTCILRPEFLPQDASMLTLLMGLSVAKACRRLYPLKAQIKWPNDVLISQKKICGILTEMGADPGRIHYVVIGVGINGNLTEFPRELEGKATSLLRELGVQIRRAPLAATVLEEFEEMYEEFSERLDLSAFREAYDEILISRGRPVAVRGAAMGAEGLRGVARGIDDRGELLVERSDGTVVRVNAGEVSVRGLDGYV